MKHFHFENVKGINQESFKETCLNLFDLKKYLQVCNEIGIKTSERTETNQNFQQTP